MSRLTEMVAARSVEDGDCLRWTGYCYNGHPGITLDGKKLLARRALWLEQRGEIPPGKVLRCTCETPLCINLEHIEPMTMRAITKIEGAAGKMSGPVRSAKIAAVKRAGKQARITQDEAQAIRASNATGREMAHLYGICEGTVSKIRRGQVRREFNSNPWMGLA